MVPTDFEQELKEIEAESIGWIPLDTGAYLHVGSDAAVIEVVGVAHASMADKNVLLLVWCPKRTIITASLLRGFFFEYLDYSRPGARHSLHHELASGLESDLKTPDLLNFVSPFINSAKAEPQKNEELAPD